MWHLGGEEMCSKEVLSFCWAFSELTNLFKCLSWGHRGGFRLEAVWTRGLHVCCVSLGPLCSSKGLWKTHLYTKIKSILNWLLFLLSLSHPGSQQRECCPPQTVQHPSVRDFHSMSAAGLHWRILGHLDDTGDHFNRHFCLLWLLVSALTGRLFAIVANSFPCH